MVLISSILLAQVSGWTFVDPRQQGQTLGNRMGWRIQVGAFIYLENAEKLALKLHEQINLPIYIVAEPPWNKVLVGDFTDKEDADSTLQVLKSLGYTDSFVRESLVNAQNDESVGGEPPGN